MANIRDRPIVSIVNSLSSSACTRAGSRLNNLIFGNRHAEQDGYSSLGRSRAMNGSPQASLRSLIDGLGEESEQLHRVGDQVLRLNLKPDDLKLWHDTHAAMLEPGNVLLACESDGCPLEATRLTWVVGAAIRSAAVNSPSDAGALLKRLGISDSLADAIPGHCPGVGDDIPWAFYLERHGWLTACPILPVT